MGRWSGCLSHLSRKDYAPSPFQESESAIQHEDGMVLAQWGPAQSRRDFRYQRTGHILVEFSLVTILYYSISTSIYNIDYIYNMCVCVGGWVGALRAYVKYRTGMCKHCYTILGVLVIVPQLA